VINGSFIIPTPKSHAHTVVDGRQSQWEMTDAKPLNRSSPNLKHVINSWKSTTKIRGQSAQGFLPHIRQIEAYTQNL